MDSDIAIRAEGLGKKYTIGHQSAERGATLRDTIVRGVSEFARMGKAMLRGQQIVTGDELEEFWALRDLDFEIKRGDVVGVIGRNGAGKSTLLKVLSRITEPTEGRVQINGRVASLLEVGTGFHPELSGRENIYLNGAILGMTRAEIRRKFDEIVAFSEVEKFLDTPVKRYSSGMYVRLAFAVAAHLEPEILIVDEVLAVGDAEFQKKCLGKMQDVAGEGRTVIFVSHNLAATQALCRNGFVLEAGRLRVAGSMQEALDYYASIRTEHTPRSIAENIELLEIKLINTDNSNGFISFNIKLLAKSSCNIQHLCLMIYGECGSRLSIVDLREYLFLPRKFSKGIIEISGDLSNLRLVNKTYEVGLYFESDGQGGDFLSLSSFLPPPPARLGRRYPVENLGYFDANIENIKLNSKLCAPPFA